MRSKFFNKKLSINCNGRLLDLNEPIIMGILNLSPDSFYDGGKYLHEEEIAFQVQKMLNEGASIIDVGGYSSRPGAEHISEIAEGNRIVPMIQLLNKHFPNIILSVDTFRSSIAEKAIQSGACMINDISGGNLDKKMFEMLAYYNVPYVLMHMKGNPQTMKHETDYKNLIEDIFLYFTKKVNELRKKGIKDIILDPGFGFSKTLEQNYELMNSLDDFKIFDLPIMVGVSRKSMVNRVLHTKPEEALNGTTVLHTIVALKGAAIFRVHDVKEAMEALKIVRVLNSTA